jgi:hypothetical protein
MTDKRDFRKDWEAMSMKTYKRDRKSPPFSANDYDDGTYGVGVNGKVWRIGTVASTHDRPSGYKRWLRSYSTDITSKAIAHTPSAEMVGYDEWIRDKTMSDDESYRGDEIGIESPMSVEEETPDEGLKGLELILSRIMNKVDKHINSPNGSSGFFSPSGAQGSKRQGSYEYT